MRKPLILGALFALAAVFFHAPSAQAELFDWSYTDGGSNFGSGTFTATDQSGGQFLLTGITGTANGQSVTGLTNYGGQDQLIYTSPPSFLDTNGFSFTVTGNIAYNMYFWISAGAGVNGYDCGVTGYCLLGPGTPGTGGLGDGGSIPADPTRPVNFFLSQVTEGGGGNVASTPLPGSLPLFGVAFAGSVFFVMMGRRRKTA